MSECVAVLAVWETPQGHSVQSRQAMLFSSSDWTSSSDEVASAVATCVQAMRQLRKLTIYCMGLLQPRYMYIHALTSQSVKSKNGKCGKQHDNIEE